MSSGPDVTVIVAAYNAMPYVTRSVTSVLRQSLGADRIELIAVDDGSTDGTGEELDRLAAGAPGMQVVHQPNSGGPAGPRNLGLERATGRYVFFLDADDHLGPEALERMVAAADENGSDVVLGRIVGEGGRRAPRSMFGRNQPKTDVFASRVYWTLNPMKLFRRELVERLGLRFDTGLSIGEDQPFTATAYLEAAAISVVADHDCLYWVAREDGNNITAQPHGTRMRMDLFRRMAELVADHVEPGPRRDTLLHRHFAVELRDAVLQWCREPHRDVQAKLLAELGELIAPYYGEGLAARLPAVVRLRCHLIRQGLLDELLTLVRWELDRGAASYGITTVAAADGGEAEEGLLVEDGHAYARYPYFRDSTLNIPDDCYDITSELRVRHEVTSAALGLGGLRLTGHASVDRIPAAGTTAVLILRRRGTGDERRFPVHGTDGAFDVTVDGASLPAGLWDPVLAVNAAGITKEARLGSRRADSVTTRTTTVVTAQGTAVALYTTKPYGNLTLDVGETRHRVPPHLAVTGVAWAAAAGPATLAVNVRCTLAGWPAGALTVRAEGPDGAELTVPVDGDRALLPLAGAGEWRVTVRLAAGDGEWTIPVPRQPGLGTARWRRRGLPWYAKPLAGREALTLRVGRVDLWKALRGRLG
ncbi:glycosyltransferase family 2 protein [Streptomyces morookaense]|uniref:Glycosyltransferase family 2 protein n=1 Tax=Streptomyces morookaense TaxID=1970 RepID=A0A7Y7B5D3_STRMO|nr:glycosyltransferase family 2 protein [Streptomyces morookaense]NVK79326.1 glycosyltransferase family 2 protein [Streptomyces morookaense]GHF42996.1 glycosyl transferase [Streptomyces morookaense]